MPQKKNINNAIAKLLSERLTMFKYIPLNRTTCIEIYQTIFNNLSDLFQEARAGLSNEALNYIAQMYYECIKINENHELDPTIFTQLAKLENIETSELAKLTTMFRESPFQAEFLMEIKRRS